MKGSRSGLSIRARLLLLVLAAVLPLLLFSAALLLHADHGSAALLRDTTLSTVRRLSLAVDAQIGRAQAVTIGLAETPLADTDAAGFEDAATRALAVAGLRGSATLARADGSEAAPRRAGRDGLPAPDPAALARLFATGQPQVSGLYAGDVSGKRLIAFHLPVWRDGQVRFDAVLSLPAQTLTTALRGQPLPEGWIGTVADRDGIIVARSQDEDAAVGQSLAPSLASLAAAASEGFGPALSRAGLPVYAAFGRSALTGWVVTVAVPRAVVHGPRLRSLGLLGGGGILLLLASFGLAWLVGRGIARPINALAHQAARLGRSELPDPERTTGVREAAIAGRALHQAGLLLAARSRERESALKRAEASEATLLLAQEAGQIGAWETDAATGRRSWSHQQAVLYGRDPEAEPPHDRAWPALIHPDDRGRVLATLATAYEAPRSYQHEFRIVLPGGDIRWLRTAGRSLFESGRPVRLVGVTLDTTDRHEAEQTLRQGAARLEAEVEARTRELADSESRFRTYFEYSADALLVVRVEPDGLFVMETLNRAGERLIGNRHEDVAGKTPEEVLLPETACAMLDLYRRVVATGAPLRLEQSLVLPAGTLDLETVLVPVRDTGSGRITRIISGQRDMTERRRLETRLSHAQRLEAVGQLTGGVAHDFNNLLTVVIGNLSLLSRRLPDDERAARYLRSIELAAERGAKLTASLLAFSRRQTLQVAPLDVGALLRESATLLQQALGEAIDFELDVPPGLPLAIADAAQLEAAVLNLAINARDAILDAMAAAPDQPGILRVRVRPAVLHAADLEGNDEARPGRFLAIQVQDTGAGMAPEVRARAFEPFFTTKDVGQGTGLGLSQVFGFARQLGGHVTLESTPGHGTTAVLFLPVAAVAPLADTTQAKPPTPMRQGATVLVVEDDDGIRDVTAEVLRDAGLNVVTAANGPEALLILRGPEPMDALFSDIVMPGGATGVDLARAARVLRPTLSVLLTSGYGGPALSRYRADGEYEVLAKPYTRAALLERLGEMLSRVGPS